MEAQNNQFTNIDNIVKRSFVYLRRNYRQLFLPFVLTCAALALFSIAKDFVWSYFYSNNVQSTLPQTYIFIFLEYALRVFFGLSYLLCFPIMLLVTRNIVLGSHASLEEIRNQPKTRIFQILLVIMKLLVPLHLINFAFSACLGFLTRPLAIHIMKGQSAVSIVSKASDNSWPLPFWAYDNAFAVTSYIYYTFTFLALSLTWYIASRWSMTLIFAALDKSNTFKQSAAFTKGYVGLIFFSISFVSVFFYTLNWALDEALIMLVVKFAGFDPWEHKSTYVYVSYLKQLLGSILLALKWILYAVTLSNIYLLIENKRK